MKKRVLAVLLVAVLALSGCTSPEQPAQQAAGAISFVDDDGVEIHLAAPARRVISLYSAHTENLYTLGAGEFVIGGHTTCIYPPEAAKTATFDYASDPETVIAAQPDLVLIRPYIRRKAPDFVSALVRAGIPVVSLYPERYEDFRGYIEKLARLVGCEAAAQRELAALEGEIKAIQAKTKTLTERQSVFFEATEVNVRTASVGSMAALAIEIAGGKNVAAGAAPVTAGSSIAAFGAERVLELADQIDVYVSQRGAMNAGGSLEAIRERPGFDTIRAVRDGRVYVLNEKLISSPAFRYGKGIRELARFLYPEIFDAVTDVDLKAPATRAGFAELVVKLRHLPLYVPSSSKYYQTKQPGHTYGLFTDVTWRDASFDAVETAVYGGYLTWERASDGAEAFHPTAPVTREALARAVFLLGDFPITDTKTKISDLNACEKPRIVQTLVDAGVFKLENGKFSPDRSVTNGEIMTALETLNNDLAKKQK